MIARALESVSVPYMLAMGIFFLMSSVAQLEAEIGIELSCGRGFFTQPGFKGKL